MAMYYQSNSEIESADNSLQTLYLMNPNYIGYSDQSQPQPQHNIFFLNPAASSAAASFAPHAPPPFVGIPLPHDPSRPPPAPAHQQDIDICATAARHHYSTWGLVDHGDQPPPPPRGLSLSLSAHRRSGFDRPPISGDRDFQAGQPSAGVISPRPCSIPSPSLTTESNGVGTMQSVIMGSRYLKFAQELLDEVVNVGNQPPQKADAVKGPTAANTEAQDNSKGGAAAADLTTAQRQEIQMKKAKLSRMLDEVEQRCRQYHHQMQMIVAAFEQAAGTGSARSYTQLALKTMMKQFRCLKSTISAQIKGLSKSLGEEEDLFEGSRLRFMDHHRLHLREQQQQLGMMQNNNAWRPHRGLPERAVSVLRAWLFQHFLHPYPKDSDKQMLAKQTGLTKSQVSNWFINARVRLWKPMVEEMYLEETKKQSNTTDDASIKPEPAAEISPPAASLPARTNFAQLITSLNMENNNLNPEKNPKKPRNAVVLSPGAADQRFGTENYLSMAAANVNRYGIGELDLQLQAAGFGGGQGNGSFSLSLALPPTEGFLSHRSFEFGTTRMDESEGGSRNVNEIVDFQNRKPFPPQLLPDFVT